MWTYMVIKGIFRTVKNETNYKIWRILKTAHYKSLNYFFFLCDCLAQAEEPGLIPVFPLSSTFVVYVTSTSNISLSEITSTLACPKNPQVTKEYSQSSKSSYPTTGLPGWAVHLNCDSILNFVKNCKGKAHPSWVSTLASSTISSLQNTCWNNDQHYWHGPPAWL